jgi:hypothetical protein
MLFLRNRLAAAALGFAAIVALGEGVAGAADVAAQLDYAAPAGCPDATDFGAVVAEHLGYVPFQMEANERVVIRIEPSGRALEGRIEWRNDAGRWAGDRAFPSRTGDCGELVHVMGFAVALQFQLLATSAAPPEPQRLAAPPAKAQTPPATPAPPTLSARPPSGSQGDLTARGPPSEASIAVGAGASAGVGLSPGVAALARLFGSVAWTRVAVELAAEISVPATTHRSDGAGVSEQVLLASLAGCGVRARWSACLLGKVGEIRAVGEGVNVPATASGVFVQGGVRLAVNQMLGRRTQIALHADGLAAMTRGIVTLDSLPVWTTPRVAATFGIDLGVRFR